ncbi:putative iron-regulated membrane protein [Pedobacter sp. UYEF25]
MLRSFWRYSHLSLAVVSSLFLFISSLTGIILAVEPIVNQSQPYQVPNFDQLTLSDILPKLRAQYPDISKLEVDANNFVKINASAPDGKNIHVFVNPTTGKILGKVKKQQEFFEWITAVHRSLFLHELGRFFLFITQFRELP